ncbi:unnamed protein product, partial [marine sediment metagenome]
MKKDINPSPYQSEKDLAKMCTGHQSTNNISNVYKTNKDNNIT